MSSDKDARDKWCASSSSSSSEEDDAEVAEVGEASRHLEAMERKLGKLGFKRGLHDTARLQDADEDRLVKEFDEAFVKGVSDGVEEGKVLGERRVARVRATKNPSTSPKAVVVDRVRHEIAKESTPILTHPETFPMTKFVGNISAEVSFLCTILHMKGCSFVWIGNTTEDPRLNHLCLGVKLPFETKGSVATTFFGSTAESIGQRLAKHLSFLTEQQCYVSYNVASRCTAEREQAMIRQIADAIKKKRGAP